MMSTPPNDPATPPSIPTQLDKPVVDKLFALAVPKDIPPPPTALNIETLEEFILEVYQKDPKEISFKGWTFTDIDFSKFDFDSSTWCSYKFEGAVFYGCILPKFDSVRSMRDRGAFFLRQFSGIPFKAMRAFMYTQQELQQHDQDIYKFYLEKDDLHSRLLEQMHDHFIQDALLDYLDGKTVIAVMGGHAMKRGSSHYRDISFIAWELARQGFVMASGGGPGAMEAANLGAYMYEQSKEDLLEALHIIASVRDPQAENEYQDRAAPKAVVERFGWPKHQPSLSIPTWKYGHEPSNMFATWIAKLFSNAIREDGLLEIANGGIIYTPGSAGTRQEIFQAACTNHYAEDGKEKPLVFFDTEYWNGTGIPQVLKKNSADRPFASFITEQDDPGKVVQYLVNFRQDRALPKVTLQELKSNYWVRGPLRALSKDFTAEIMRRNSARSASGDSANGSPPLRAKSAAPNVLSLSDPKQGKVPSRHHRVPHLPHFHGSKSLSPPPTSSDEATVNEEWVHAKKKREKHKRKRREKLRKLCNDFTALEMGIGE